MELKLEVANEKFQVSVGAGYGDFVWLASYAAKLYGNKIYPKGNYLPTLLKIQSLNSVYHPHPRKKINAFFHEANVKPQNIIVKVNIRKNNHIFTQSEIQWQKQAFGQERNIMDLHFKYLAFNLNRKKQFYFVIELQYKMYEEVKHLYNENNYKSHQEIKMKENIINPTQSQFEIKLTLPLGHVKPTLLYYSKEQKNDEYKSVKIDENILKQNPKNIYISEIEPSIASKEQILEKIKEDMKIQENISKSLQEKQQESKKKSGNNPLCCYSFEQLWNIISSDYQKELSLSAYEQSTIDRIKIIIEKNLSKIYEIFFYYFIIYSQQKQKKQDLVITYQDVMHFFKFYEILKDSKSIFHFFDFYNADNKIKNLSDTIDLNNGIKFPQFISIILRATQFIQTTNLMVQGETFDQSVNLLINKMLKIQNNQQEFNIFHRNLRQYTRLIGFVRDNSLQLTNIFIRQIEQSIQTSQNNYHMMKEELKTLLEECGFQGDFDSIINECFNQLFGQKQKYKKFEEGIFFYEFIQIIQWLAIVLIEGGKQQQQQYEDGDQEIMVLMQKIKFLINKMIEKK